MKNIFSAATWN